jgi:hypothetical protein
MPATIRLPVGQEEQARLARYYDETDQAETRTRAQMVLLAAAGHVCKRPTWTLRRKAAEQPEWAKNV